MKADLLPRLKEIISTEWGMEPSEITPNSLLQGDLNADPLSIADLMVKLEEVFDINIPADTSSSFKTVNDMMEFILEKSGEL